MALAICNLLISLEGEKTDYVVACMFLISASTILKIRWWMGAAILFSCVLTALCMEKAYSTLPSEALGHLFLAWMCGTMVGYQSDYGRRCGMSLRVLVNTLQDTQAILFVLDVLTVGTMFLLIQELFSDLELCT